MTEATLIFDFAAAGAIAPLNGVIPTAGLSEEERELAMLEEHDERWCVGQQLVAIGPPGKPSHGDPARTRVLAHQAEGYRVEKYKGCTSVAGKDAFIHNNAMGMWRPTQWIMGKPVTA